MLKYSLIQIHERYQCKMSPTFRTAHCGSAPNTWCEKYILPMKMPMLVVMVNALSLLISIRNLVSHSFRRNCVSVMPQHIPMKHWWKKWHPKYIRLTVVPHKIIINTDQADTFSSRLERLLPKLVSSSKVRNRIYKMVAVTMAWPDGLPADGSHVKYDCSIVGREWFEYRSVSLIHQ